MKIELFARHWGLADLLRNIFEKDNEVIINKDYGTFPKQYNFNYGENGDVWISTFPYEDLKLFKKDRPIILYATDPVPFWMTKEVEDIQKWKGCITVAAEPCYPKHIWPINYEFIAPYAIDLSKYKMWTGGINKVAVVNRKARERWKEVVGGGLGLHYELEQLFEKIPFDIFSEENPKNPMFYDIDLYRETLSKYDVLFYYSNSPYTIVMFEAMSIKMPIVAFPHNHLCTYKPVEKYIENYDYTIDGLRTRLKLALANPKKTEYPLIPFDNIVKKWNTILNEAYDRYKGL